MTDKDKAHRTNDQKPGWVSELPCQKQTEASEAMTRHIEQNKVPRSTPTPLRSSGDTPSSTGNKTEIERRRAESH